MKKINVPLTLGLILLIFISFFYIFPEKFTSKNPLDMTKHRTYKVIENGREEYKVEIAPIAPNKDYYFGTSRTGHDLYTRIIYGTKNTINTVLLVVVMRFVLALIFGVPAGMDVRGAKAIVKVFSTVFTAIPALIFSFLILSINFVNGLELEESILIYAIVLTIVGWGKLANQIQDNTKLIMKEEFIEGEIAIGKSKLKVMLQNIIPHLMPNLVVLLFLEAGLVLFLMAQLAVLSIFLGPPIIYRNFNGTIDFMAPSEAAWSNELFYGVMDIRFMQKYYYWVLLFPALAIFTGILAFNLTGEGLRIEFEKRTSKVVSSLKRTGRMISPKLYIHQVKRFKKYYKPVVLKTLCVLVLLMSAFTPASKSMYEFNTEESLKHIVELTKDEYEGRMSGYDGGHKAGEYIIETLKGYGIEPYDGENYTQEFDVTSKISYWDKRKLGNVLIKEAEISLENENGDLKRYELGKDFGFAAMKKTYISNDFKDEFIEVKGKTILKENTDTMQQTDIEKYILVERVEGRREHWKTASLGPAFVKGFKFLINDDFDIDKLVCKYNDIYTYIIPFGELKEKITTGNYEVNIKIKKPDIPKYPSRNIFGVLPGKDWHDKGQTGKQKRIIMIGGMYDSLRNGKHGSSFIDTTGTAVNLEIARTLSQLKGQLDETIVFAFWDARYTEHNGSYHYNVNKRLFSSNSYDIIYFDIGDIADESIENIGIMIDQYRMMKLENSHKTIEGIKNSLKKQKINHLILPVDRGWSPFHQLYLSADLRISLSAPRDEYLFTENDNIDNIDNKKVKEIGQFIIDMITIEKLFK